MLSWVSRGLPWGLTAADLYSSDMALVCGQVRGIPEYIFGCDGYLWLRGDTGREDPPGKPK